MFKVANLHKRGKRQKRHKCQGDYANCQAQNKGKLMAAKTEKPEIHEVEFVVDKLAKSGETAHIVAESFPNGLGKLWVEVSLLKQLAPNRKIEASKWVLTIAQKVEGK
jgi:hypothetical protein